ncbi:MAG: GNAT family N-acetyltransferase [Patescibacteria group bacterium]|nr:GNAT family N-acetyltransferase [Patescibacteria group bacterium]
MNNCEICAFRNPKAVISAIILKDNKLLVFKRAEDPLKGHWDIPGGFMDEGESLEEATRREIKEETGIDAKEVTFIKTFPGITEWEGNDFPVLNFFYLVDIGDQEIQLNDENSEFDWISLAEVNPENIAFEANQRCVQWLKDNFAFNIERVKELTTQLDDSAIVKEQSLYRAILSGYVSKEYDGDTLIGMGWIFPRQTMLRKQAVVEDMIVDDAYRGRGLGRKLLDNLVQWARQEGVEMIELTSNPKREAANGLYKKYGFELHPTNHYLYKV